jgi:hypothetical protein
MYNVSLSMEQVLSYYLQKINSGGELVLHEDGFMLFIEKKSNAFYFELVHSRQIRCFSLDYFTENAQGVF